MQQKNLGGFLVVRPAPLRKQKEPFCFLLQSDIHVGSSHSDLDLVREELEWARQNNARILINGDVIDGVYHGDKRFRPSCIKPELAQRDDTLDAEIDLAFDLYQPYADLLDCIGVGNHDDARTKYSHSDPGLRLVQKLNADLAAQGSRQRVWYGGYAGMIIYALPGDQRFTVVYHHGYGKSSALSGAMGQYSAMQYVEGADVIWLGHLHARMNASVCRLRPPLEGYEPEVREVRFVRTGAYIQSHQGQTPEHVQQNGRRTSYAADAGFPLHGRGGARVLLHPQKDKPYRIEVTQ